MPGLIKCVEDRCPLDLTAQRLLVTSRSGEGGSGKEREHGWLLQGAAVRERREGSGRWRGQQGQDRCFGGTDNSLLVMLMQRVRREFVDAASFPACKARTLPTFLLGAWGSDELARASSSQDHPVQD